MNNIKSLKRMIRTIINENVQVSEIDIEKFEVTMEDIRTKLEVIEDIIISAGDGEMEAAALGPTGWLSSIKDSLDINDPQSPASKVLEDLIQTTT